jgi:hypothetical protein
MSELVAELLVNSSSNPEPYTVLVEQSEDGITLKCNCRAGIFYKYCKHKQAVVLGDSSILADDSQQGDLDYIGELIQKSSYPTAFDGLKELDDQLKDLKKKVKAKKDAIVDLMKEGG